MIKAELSEFAGAYRGITRINEENRFREKATVYIARMLRKMKGEVAPYEEAQVKLMRDAGAIVSGAGYELPKLLQGKDEPDHAFEERMAKRRAEANDLSDQLRKLGAMEGEIDLDPIPWSIINEGTEEQKNARQFSGNDLSSAWLFFDMEK